MRTAAALLLAGGLAWAGGAANSRSTSAVIALENGDAAMAVEKAEAALRDRADLKPKNVPRTWRTLAAAHLQLREDGDATHPLAALAAAGECAADERWGEDCRGHQEQAALLLLDHLFAHHEPAPGHPDAAAVAAGITRAWPESWVGPLAEGFVAMEAGDRRAAAGQYTRSAERAAAGARPVQPHVFAVLASFRVTNTLQIAGLDAARTELAAFSEALRARHGAGPHGPALQDALASATGALKSAEDALARLEKAATAADAPTDKRVEWATLLDQMGQFDAATAAWRAAAESDPAHFEAWYFWGVHHYNRAAGLMDADPDAARKQLEAARGPFEHAAGLKPDDAQLRSTLVNLCAVTGDLPCMQRYETRAP